MQSTGTKLVLSLLGAALALGMISWWYRYAAAHRASQFWGPEASRLIAESSGLELFVELPADAKTLHDLSRARGQAHLRHALLSDRNYRWENRLDAASIRWKWTLRFFGDSHEAWIALSDDLRAIGKHDQSSGTTIAYSCEPMTSSLQQYFDALGLLAKPPAPNASTPLE